MSSNHTYYQSSISGALEQSESDSNYDLDAQSPHSGHSAAAREFQASAQRRRTVLRIRERRNEHIDELSSESEEENPENEVSITAYIDIEVPAAPQIPLPANRRRSNVIKPVKPVYERRTTFMFTAGTKLEKLVSSIATKLQCETSAIPLGKLMWRYETPANANPKPFGDADGMAALLQRIIQNNGRKPIIITMPAVQGRAVLGELGVNGVANSVASTGAVAAEGLGMAAGSLDLGMGDVSNVRTFFERKT